MRNNLPGKDHEVPVAGNQYLVSRTNAKGVITDANDSFCQVSGFSHGELRGQAYNIVRHPDMPQAVFQQMWQDLKAGRAGWASSRIAAKTARITGWTRL